MADSQTLVDASIHASLRLRDAEANLDRLSEELRRCMEAEEDGARCAELRCLIAGAKADCALLRARESEARKILFDHTS